MTCIYKEPNDLCGLYCPATHAGMSYRNSAHGFSEEDDGCCSVDGDENPYNSCDMYEPVGGDDDDDDDYE